jgi:hypothetical protein
VNEEPNNSPNKRHHAEHCEKLLLLPPAAYLPMR